MLQTTQAMFSLSKPYHQEDRSLLYILVWTNHLLECFRPSSTVPSVERPSNYMIFLCGQSMEGSSQMLPVVLKAIHQLLLYDQKLKIQHIFNVSSTNFYQLLTLSDLDPHFCQGLWTLLRKTVSNLSAIYHYEIAKK